MNAEERQGLRLLIDEARRARVATDTNEDLVVLGGLCCERCGEPFEPSPRPGCVKRFCSMRCRRRAANTRYQARAWESNEGFRERKRARARVYQARQRVKRAKTAAVSAKSKAAVSDTEEGTYARAA